MTALMKKMNEIMNRLPQEQQEEALRFVENLEPHVNGSAGASPGAQTIGQKLAALGKQIETEPCDLPDDLAANHDHYLRGLILEDNLLVHHGRSTLSPEEVLELVRNEREKFALHGE